MVEKGDLRVHAMFGDTNRADGVPDHLVPSPGPVYLEGRLVLSLSFQIDTTDAQPISKEDKPLERYLLWDDLTDAWHDDGLQVLRFEQTDVVVRLHPQPTTLWEGAVDTRARVIPEPDFDEAGMAANQCCDLRWKRL